MPFDHTKIEPKWQKYWDENKTFKTDCYDDSKPKYLNSPETLVFQNLNIIVWICSHIHLEMVYM